MNMALKRLNPSRCALPLIGLLVFFCHCVSAQSTISNYSTLRDALQSSTDITNFSTNTTITLTSAGQTLQITNDMTIDGTTNNVVIDGSGLTRLIHVFPKVQLIINNVQLLNGASSSGSAIFNEGTLIMSNAILAGNTATNIAGVNGTTNSNGGDGTSGGNGGSAYGGAIYSTGSLTLCDSVIGTNSAFGGAGGIGGDGGDGVIFAGDGGNGGNGGGAYGAAIYSTGSNNVFFADEFIDNQCTGAPGGAGGSTGSGAFAGSTGQGGTGGAAAGGALYIAGNVSMSNCLFYLNSTAAGSSAGAQVTFTGSGPNGSAGGSAVGGGLFITSVASSATIENTIFFENSCTGGSGGSGPAQGATGGNGGTAVGGGLDCQAARALVRACTLATNTLVGGTNGTGANGSGSIGATAGWDICRTAGTLDLSESILAGGTNAAPNYKPNASGVTDAGFNICSDQSINVVTATTLTNTLANLDSDVSQQGGPTLGPIGVAGPAMLTLAILGPPAEGYLSGVAGVTYPATDERLEPRGSPASAGAFELDTITLATNSPIILAQPADETLNPGATATFSVSVDDSSMTTNYSITTNYEVVTNITALTTNYSTNITSYTTNIDSIATNTAAYGYQWLLNSNVLSDNSTFSGVNTSNLTVKNVSLTQQGAYQVVVGNSLLEGVVTSAVAELVVKVPVKITSQPKSKLNQPQGASVNFSVTATGAQPLSYQWMLNGNPLSDGGEFSGSTTSNLLIDPVTMADAGTYSVLVANAYSSLTSAKVPLTVVADHARPTVSITSPTPNSRTTNTLISGKATDNAQVTNVLWSITNINDGVITTDSGVADLSTNGTTTRTWTISGAVLPGTNIVAVRSVDFSGNMSATVTEKFFNVATAPFSLTVNGTGTIKGSASIAGNAAPTNGATLNIGEAYTLTAVPGKDFVFSNWNVGGFTSNSATLHFIMEDGLAVAANFETNGFIGTDGTYSGLFFNTNNVTEESAGMLSGLTLTPQGAYTAKLLLNGGDYSFSGSFDVSGRASKVVSVPASKGGPVTLSMMLDFTTGELTGSVSNGAAGWNSGLYAEETVSADGFGSFNISLEPGGGYLVLTNRLGHLQFSGALPDGAAISGAPALGKLGDAPLFESLYGNAGLVIGWLTFTNGSVEADTSIYWIKPATKTNSAFVSPLNVEIP
jgi:hypothetical protein